MKPLKPLIWSRKSTLWSWLFYLNQLNSDSQAEIIKRPPIRFQSSHRSFKHVPLISITLTTHQIDRAPPRWPGGAGGRPWHKWTEETERGAEAGGRWGRPSPGSLLTVWTERAAAAPSSSGADGKTEGGMAEREGWEREDCDAAAPLNV